MLTDDQILDLLAEDCSPAQVAETGVDRDV